MRNRRNREARLGQTLVIGGAGRAAGDLRLILLTHSELRRAPRGASREDVDQRALISDFPPAIAAQENALTFRSGRKARAEASWRFWCDLRFHHGWVVIATCRPLPLSVFVPYPVWVCNREGLGIGLNSGEASSPVVVKARPSRNETPASKWRTL